jgi:ABC-type transporter Mla MlaB component
MTDNGASVPGGRHARFGISVDKDESHVAVDLCGTLDEEGAGLVALWLAPLVLLERLRTVVIDIGLVTTVTADGLDTLVELIELAQHRQCTLQIIAGGPGRAAPLRLDGPAGSVLNELLRSVADQNKLSDP